MSKPVTIYDLFYTSESMEKEGIVLRYGPDNQFEFTVARAGGKNRKFLEERDKFLKQFEPITKDNSDEFLANVWATSIIKGWKGITDKNGKALEFNAKNIKQVLLDMPVLFEDIRKQSQDFTRYLDTILEEAEKN